MKNLSEPDMHKWWTTVYQKDRKRLKAQIKRLQQELARVEAFLENLEQSKPKPTKKNKKALRKEDSSKSG